MKTQLKTKAVILCSSIILLTNFSWGQNNNGSKHQKKRPTVDEIFKQMDTNKDDKLVISEAKGPIKNDFSTIDTNNDGFITKEELEKAPKPKGERPPRR